MTKEEMHLQSYNNVIDILYNRKDVHGLKKYDGFIPFDPDILDNLGGENVNGIFIDATPECLDFPLNISVFHFAQIGVKDCDGDNLIRIKKADPKTIRKLTNRFSVNGYTVEWQNFQDNFKSYIMPVELHKNETGDKMRVILPHNMYPKDWGIVERAKKVLCCFIGLQFVMENVCSVYVKPENSEIGMRIPLTTLSSAKDIFKMRDIEPGMKRRSALKHFVSEHTRRCPINKNETIQIARYLRGAEKFDWNGFKCVISIPEHIK